MPKYKVTYFETTGVVEVIRLILSHAGESFEDVRIAFEQWPDEKKTIPFERLPVVEIDGVQYHQSLAISRYLARQYDLAGKDDKENLEIDAIVDTINDFRISFTACLWDSNTDAKMKKRKELLTTTIPFFLNKFTTLVKNNGGYLWGNRLTWADLTFLGILPYMNLTVDQNILDDYPELHEYTEKISNIPNIRKWLNERPDKCCLRELLKLSPNNVIGKSD